MKKLLLIVAFLVSCVVMQTGCKTGMTQSQQDVAYVTINTVDQAATAAYSGYCDLVIHGTLSTNSLPQVSQRYNQVRLACLLAAAVGQSGTNAMASDSLITDLNGLINLISTIKK